MTLSLPTPKSCLYTQQPLKQAYPDEAILEPFLYLKLGECDNSVNSRSNLITFANNCFFVFNLTFVFTWKQEGSKTKDGYDLYLPHLL